MTSMFRDFDAEFQEESGDPITFKLKGTTFTCVNPVPIGAMVVMGRHISSANKQQQAGAFATALWSLVVPEQHEEFERAMAKVTNMDQVEAIITYVQEAATGRPSEGV